MAAISKFLFLRRLRSDPIYHVLQYRSGRLVKSGRGLSFFFLPLSTSIATVPTDDRDQTFLFRGKTADHQEVTAQGVVTYRVARPEKLAERVDFSVDLGTGAWTTTPLEKLAAILTQLAQQFAGEYLERAPVRQALRDGVEKVRELVRTGLGDEPIVQQMGLEVVSVRVQSVAPTVELDRALQATVREAIQQEADQAVFARRAMAVEKERAIAENELQTKLELARREELLIAQQGANELRKAKEQGEAKRVLAEADATKVRLHAAAEADSIRATETARVEAERERMAVVKELPGHVLAGLAARELASKLTKIEHLTLSPDTLGPLLTDLVRNASRKLEDKKAS